MSNFLERYLDPAERLGEIMFALIMALGFTAAARLGHQDADNQALFITITGCNLSWAIVDGVIYALTALFERGRQARIARDALFAPSEEAALACIRKEVDGPLLSITTPQEREQIHRWVLAVARRKGPPPPPRIRAADLLGGLAVATVIALATLPIVAPLLIWESTAVGVRVSNTVAVIQLFLLGLWWGRVVGAGAWRVALGVTVVGLSMVALTIALGG